MSCPGASERPENRLITIPTCRSWISTVVRYINAKNANTPNTSAYQYHATWNSPFSNTDNANVAFISTLSFVIALRERLFTAPGHNAFRLGELGNRDLRP